MSETYTVVDDNSDTKTESKETKFETTANKILDYTVTRTEQMKINTSKSKTLPTLIFWMVYLCLCIGLKVILKNSVHNLSYLAIIAGVATFTYMGLEYSDAFIKNSQLPTGRGKIVNINRYRFLVYAWNIISIAVSLCYYIFKTENLPHNEVMGVAGILSIEFIAGNKLNRVATTLDGKVKEMKEEDKDGKTIEEIRNGS